MSHKRSILVGFAVGAVLLLAGGGFLLSSLAGIVAYLVAQRWF